MLSPCGKADPNGPRTESLRPTWLRILVYLLETGRFQLGVKVPEPFLHISCYCYCSRSVLFGPEKDRLLLLPADIRPIKGQLDFLSGLLFEGARRPSAVQRLRGITLVVAGGCDGNQTYCTEVVQMAQRVNAEKLLNVVVADQLKAL